MIAVIFEVAPREGRQARYFEVAASLHEALRECPGFVSVERFESVTRPGKFLSLSFWADEAAVAGWRGNAAHRVAQQEGRDGVFASYRLRVAQVVRDYGLDARDAAPSDSRAALR